jgi:hypothetical protein
MKTLQRPSTKQKLALERLVVDTFPTTGEMEIPLFGALSVSNCTLCPSHPDSLCPCCTGPQQCP